MKNNLIKLSLITILAAVSTQALANPNNQQNNTEQDEIIISKMGPNVCPDMPHCIDLEHLELEEDQ